MQLLQIINFLAADRSDVQFASKEASRRMSAPRMCDWSMVKRIGRYLLGRPRAVHWFCWQDRPDHFSVYSDSNWAGCKATRKSTSGACLMWGSHVLKSYSRTQSNIALSSGEAQLYATVTAASEGLGLTAMAGDFGLEMRSNVHVDGTAAIGIAERKGLGKVRHLDTQALWIQDAVRSRRVTLEKVLGTENPADMMTKHLGQRHIDEFLRRIWKIAEGRAAAAPKLNNNKDINHVAETELWEGMAAEAKKKSVRWADLDEDDGFDSLLCFAEDTAEPPPRRRAAGRRSPRPAVGTNAPPRPARSHPGGSHGGLRCPAGQRDACSCGICHSLGRISRKCSGRNVAKSAVTLGKNCMFMCRDGCIPPATAPTPMATASERAVDVESGSPAGPAEGRKAHNVVARIKDSRANQRRPFSTRAHALKGKAATVHGSPICLIKPTAHRLRYVLN